MSYYNITILVTAEQEEAIIDLYKAKCWVYLKSGENRSTNPGAGFT